ncbi:MAG: hypothetical protein JAZ17_07895 [Candidatus Thiodiazotropha endolucinida]|nr:hypothetical protein [Candidatus Thiodiazotropha endolucinida]
MTELSDGKSSLNHLHFWVDCKNKQRIYLDEFQINKGSAVLTQQEKSWDKQSASIACQKAITDRALIPSEVDIHTIGHILLQSNKWGQMKLKRPLLDANKCLLGNFVKSALVAKVTRGGLRGTSW